MFGKLFKGQMPIVTDSTNYGTYLVWRELYLTTLSMTIDARTHRNILKIFSFCK